MEQVTVEPKGEWSKLGEPGSDAGTGNGPRDDNADDDLIEIKDTRLSTLKEEPRGSRLSIQHITPERSREQSMGSRQSSSKRPASQVIDLTGSDEEDMPQRPPKRLSYNQPTRSFPQHGFREISGGRNGNVLGVGISSQSNSNSPIPTPRYYDA